MQIGTLILTTQEAIMAAVFSVVVLIVYLVILVMAKKFTNKVRYVRKTANVLAALFIWIELVLGDLVSLFGEKGLSFAIILAAIIAIVNAIEDD